MHSERYHLIPVDLKQDPDEIFRPIVSTLLDPFKPILLIFECVLAYIEPGISSKLLKWFVQWCKGSPCGVLGCIVYEMFGLNDSFGRVMLDNLKVREYNDA